MGLGGIGAGRLVQVCTFNPTHFVATRRFKLDVTFGEHSQALGTPQVGAVVARGRKLDGITGLSEVDVKLI